MFTREQIKASMRLYAVTDRTWLHGRSLGDCVVQALAGGATCVQLREKEANEQDLEAIAPELKSLCAQAGVPFIINDYLSLARGIDADGLHIGQGDMTCEDARAILGPTKIIGVSVQTVPEALAAQAAGADYLGVGALFATSTKSEAEIVTAGTLKEICAAVSLPVVAIGGLNLSTIPLLSGTGVDGVAVVSAIFAADDIVEETRKLRVSADALSYPKE